MPSRVCCPRREWLGWLRERDRLGGPMPTSIMGRALAALLFAACMGCTSLAEAAGLPSEIGAQAALGKNLTGDVCVLRAVSPGAFGDKAVRHLIFCEGWEQPSGQLIRMPAAARTAK